MAINPKIKQKAEDIRSKIFGSEVRESLASGIEAISEDVEATIGRQDYVEEQFQDVLDETTGKDVISAPELIAARNGKSNLKTRLDDEHAQVTAQLHQIDTHVRRDYVTPEMFGAVGDGVTDDYEALRQCFLANTKKIVFGKVKTYSVSKLELRLSHSNITIDGNSATIKLMDNSGLLETIKSTGGNFNWFDKFIIIEGANTHIHNLVLDANADNNFFIWNSGDQYAGKYHGYHPDLNVPGMPARYMTTYGIYSEGAWNIKIENCIFKGLGQAIGLGGGIAGTTFVQNNYEILNCEFQNGFRDQIYIFQARKVRINKCTFIDNQRKALQFYQNVQDGKITDCKVIVTTANIRKWYPTWNISQGDCELSAFALNNPNYPEEKYNVDNTTITDCYFSGLKTSIRIRNYSKNLSVKNCTFDNCIGTITADSGIRGILEAESNTFNNCTSGVLIRFNKSATLSDTLTETYRATVKLVNNLCTGTGTILTLDDTYNADKLYNIINIELYNNTVYSPANFVTFTIVRTTAPTTPFVNLIQRDNHGGADVISYSITGLEQILKMPISLASAHATSGYTKDEKTGLIRQWGYLSVDTQTYNQWLNFPIPFPNEVLNMVYSFNAHDAGGNPIALKGYCYPDSKTQYRVRFTDTDATTTTRKIYWQAVGW